MAILKGKVIEGIWAEF